MHHEVELGVVIGKGGTDISEFNAMEHIGGYLLALDMTAQDLLDFAKTNGHPWALAKSWKSSCPINDFIPKDKIPNPAELNLWLKVNGKLKQDGNTMDMIFKVPFLISFISRYFTLEEGDVILTGTPSGVGPVTNGDTIQAGLGENIALLHFQLRMENDRKQLYQLLGIRILQSLYNLTLYNYFCKKRRFLVVATLYESIFKDVSNQMHRNMNC